jgi:hypothetical protein
LLILGTVACSAAPAREVAPPRHPASKPSATSTHAPVVWDGWAELSAWPPVIAEPYVSRGHPPGDAPVTLRISPAARESYLSLHVGSELPTGAMVGQFQPDGVFVMRKLAPGRWEFVELSKDGHVRDADRRPLCERCHAEAVADDLFGLPLAE